MNNLVYVALSGGVDSAAAAILLKERGYEVRGVTLRLKPHNLADADIADAQKVANRLGIPLDILDERESFKAVTDYFCESYLQGLTPNPCVFCNPNIKIGKLVEHALRNGADFIATGHYSDIIVKDGIYYIKKNPTGKDQSYFLCRLNQHLLSHVMFPLSDLSKEEIRALAQSRDIEVAHKKDSQEVCFIPDNAYISFIEKEFKPKALCGDFLSTDGKKLGTHQGIYKYTIGQRKGLGAFGKPMYVISINPENNSVTIGDNEELFTSKIFVDDLSFLSGRAPADKFECLVKIRCAAKPTKANIKIVNNGAIIEFDQPQRAAAPGQTAAIYIDDILIGGATICNP
ncbi:MAG: tRNA 2-thiouridine(34) synthase MnmA [Clostridia bacterium]|nr:tRNA 2-thiouridine(34) synthase MnmA [Clostridia bacterium]